MNWASEAFFKNLRNDSAQDLSSKHGIQQVHKFSEIETNGYYGNDKIFDYPQFLTWKRKQQFWKHKKQQHFCLTNLLPRLFSWRRVFFKKILALQNPSSGKVNRKNCNIAPLKIICESYVLRSKSEAQILHRSRKCWSEYCSMRT